MEENEELDWKAVGRRWLEKRPCSHCEESGFVSSSLTLQCGRCVGNGWLESESNELEICPECKGMRSIVRKEKKVCSHCEGRGVIPCLMQRFQAVVWICRKCNGKGDYADETKKTRCEECEGRGEIFEGTYSIKTWDDSPWREHIIDVAKEDKYGIATIYELDFGGRVISKPCDEDSCGGLVAPHSTCPKCNGTGRVFAVWSECKHCEGTGRVFVRFVCDECVGEGKKIRYEDREV